MRAGSGASRRWQVLRQFRAQLLILGVLVGLEIAKTAGLIPPPSDLLKAAGVLLEKGGWPLLLPVSFLEHLVGVNVYFPGSIVIFVAVSSLSGSPWLAVIAVLFTITGAVIAHQVNYIVGKRFQGTRGDPATKPSKPISWSMLGMFTMFWHPHFGAMAALLAGRERVSYPRVTLVIIAGTIFWQTLWGFFAYNVGRAAGNNNFGFWPMVACVLIWAGVDWYRTRTLIAR